MNPRLPEDLEAWAETRVSEGAYASTHEYIGDLVRRDREAEEARRRLKAAIEIGRASGISNRTIDDIIQASREQD
ncbi:type II toxin-antitoxin system ParD family antitoxin [Sphingomonas sp. HF-S4]|uniref:Type II toxin-antitoxin system ParD family antitoxin n=1 Tax=Sphingomonas agrestis TaxID=3080540 RepID=A0ABU3YBD4_9SPHN|nr:type II toxin-antitoxin system ParD family antitoxin [Sphingomonas sp. HF-S4]MDV3458704.1 type II toxin-antitoxin system ParD family antitoxin [Sphingomonas sp. HF-S4]